jgi:hypothetical protein
MQFYLFGPHDVPTQGRTSHTKPSAISNRLVAIERRFWSTVDASAGGPVSTAQGVYVFDASSRNRRFMPWYVGKTETAFKTRFSAPDEKANLNELLLDLEPAALVRVWFYARVTPKGAIATGLCPRQSVDVLENMVIAAAYKRNPRLLNTHGKAMLRDLRIEGWPNAGDPQGKKRESVKEFRSMMGIS